MSTLEQVYLDRQRMKEESQGATESTRSALSAVSGRNILKTKEETAKIKRDEANAAAKTAAQIAQNDAALGVTAAKAENAVAVQKDKTLRQEALRMLNLGVYDAKMPAVLGMPENTVRSAAENRAEVYRRAEEQKKAAAKAKSDYEAAVAALRNQEAEIADLQKKQAANQRELSAAEKNLAAAIDEFEKANASSLNVNTAKDDILESAYKKGTESAIDPEIVEKIKNDFEKKQKDPNRFNVVSQAKQNIEGYKKKKELEAEKVAHLEKMAEMYDQLMSQRIAAKKEAGEKLSLLEMTFQAASEKSISANITAARLKKDSAETMEEYQSAYQAYLDTLNGAVGHTMIAMEVALGQAADRSANYEQLTEEEQSNVKDQISAAESLVSALRRELQVEDFTIEQQDALSAGIESVEAMIVELKKAEEYAVTYEEYKDTYAYQQMDKVYGSFSITDLEAELARLKGTKKELPVITRANAFEATPAYAEALKNNKAVDEQIEKLQGYLESRITAEKQAEEDVEADALISHFAGENRIEKELSAISSVRGEVDDYERYDMFCSLYLDGPSGAPTTTEDVEGDSIIVYKNADGEVEGYGYITSKGDVWRLAVVGSDEYNANMAKVNYDEAKEQLRLLTASFHRNIGEDAVALFDESSLEAAASAFSKKYDREEFENLDGVHRKYAKGLEGYNEGNYGDFYEDVDRFVRGDYGKWTKEEAQRVLALMENEGTDVGFLYYASVREDVLLRVAEDLNGFARTMGGLVSGPANFVLNGGTMIKNALEQDYARIAGNGLTASHQVNLQKMEEMGFAGDALEMLYMSGYSIIDMLPTVALATIPVVGKAASSGYHFAKVTAETYTADIAQGKRSDESFTHSILNAIAEVAMERILGGIPQIASKSGLGAKLGAALENLASTPVMKKVLRVAGSMGAEGFEEFAQEVISPFLAKVAADVNGISDAELEQIDWDEAAKSFAIGAITGGFFDIIDISGENVRSSASYQMLASGDAVSMIEVGARLGNKRALEIKHAIQQEKPRYQGQQGLFAYASVGDMNNIQKSIKRKGAKKNLQALSAKIDAKMKSADTAKINGAKKMFQKIIYGKTLTVQEAAQIINDPVLKSIFEDIVGMDITYLMPNEMAALARLAAFMDENGKISKSRLDLFRDAFGEIDYKAIEQILKYSDMTAGKLSGVLYEDPAAENNLTPAEQETAEVMKLMSEETGILFLVTESHETGDYLAGGLMAVNRNDLGDGIFYQVGHRTYYVAKQLNPEHGAAIKDIVLKETERLIGDDGVSAEIKKIRQQKLADGMDIDDMLAEDELCARMLPSILLKSAEIFVKNDVDAANVLRKAMNAVNGHLLNQFYLTNNYNATITVEDVEVLRNIGKNSVSQFSEEDLKKSEKWEYKLYKELGIKSPFFCSWFGHWRAYDEKRTKIVEEENNQYTAGKTQNIDTGFIVSWGNDLKGETINHAVGEKVSIPALFDIKTIAENAVLFDTYVSIKSSKQKMPNTALMHSFYVLYDSKNSGMVLLKMFAEEALSNNGKVIFRRAYQLKDIEKVADIPDGVLFKKEGLTEGTSTTTISISDLFNLVKEYDKDFRFKPVNPSLLNEDGTPRAFYRETEDGSKEVVPIKEYGFPNYAEAFDTDFTKGVVDRLSAAIKSDRAEKLGYRNGDAFEADPLTEQAKAWERNIHVNDDVDGIGTERSFDGTENIKRAGITIDGSVGRYDGTEMDTVEREKELKKYRRKISSFKRRNKITAAEVKYAKGIVSGSWTAEEAPKNLRKDMVDTLAQMYAHENELKGRSDLLIRKFKIQMDLDKIAEKDARYLDKSSSFVQRVYRNPATILFDTPKRVLQVYFGFEQGERIWARYFAPVHQNNMHKELFKQKWRNELTLFEGKDGKLKKLNELERVLVQKLIESEAYERLIADEKIGEKLKGATAAVVDGELSFDEAIEEYGLKGKETLATLQNCITAYTLVEEIQKAIDANAKDVDSVRMKNAVRAYKEVYELFYKVANEFLIAHGMEPIGKIDCYTPHMQIKNFFDRFIDAVRAVGEMSEVSDIPVAIAGLTGDFSPNRKFDPHFLQRKGNATDYDIYYSFERYLDYFSQVIFHTDDVMRIKALERMIRNRFSAEGMQKEYKQAKAIAEAPIERQKEYLVDRGLAAETSELSNDDVARILSGYLNELDDKMGIGENASYAAQMVKWLKDMHKIRAGKQSELDRSTEDISRKGLRLGATAFSFIKASKVTGSFSSLFKQPLQLANAQKHFGNKVLINAVADVVGKKVNSEFYDSIPLLVGKNKSDVINPGFYTRMGNVVGWLAGKLDYWTASIVARAGYIDAVKKGMNGYDALRRANSIATDIMGSREQLEKPKGFHAKNLLMQAATAFAVEAHNSLENLTFDTVANYVELNRTEGRSTAVKELVRGVLTYLIMAFMLNRLDDELMNQTPLPFDLIGVCFSGVAAGYGITDSKFYQEFLDNCIEAISDERPFETVPKEREFDAKKMFEMWGEEVLDDHTILSNISMLLGLSGSSALLREPINNWERITTDFERVWNLSEDTPAETKADVWIDLVSNLLGVIPLGGNQIRKITQGAKTSIFGGYYKINDDGERQLAYPVEGVGETIKSVLFGRYGSYAAKEYFDLDREPLTVEQTALYDSLVDAGVGKKDAYNTILEMKGIKKTTEKGNQTVDKDGQRKFVLGLSYTEEQKFLLFKSTLSDTARDAVEVLVSDGVSKQNTMDAYMEYRAIDDDPEFEGEEKNKATEFSYYLDLMVSDPKEREVIKESKTFQFGVLGAVRAKEYEAMTATGVSFDDAYDTYFAVAALEPKAGEKSVATVDQYLTINEMDLPENSKKAALIVYGSDADKRRMTIAFDDEISSDQFVQVKNNIEAANEAAGKKTASNVRIQAAIDATDGLTVRQKAVLWQVFSSADTAKNNPYSAQIGWEALAKAEQYKNEEKIK